MRCNICDKALTEAEILIDPTGQFEPCSICMEIALDAAYCDGFVRDEDPIDSSEFDTESDPVVETLDLETFTSEYHQYDLGFHELETSH